MSFLTARERDFGSHRYCKFCNVYRLPASDYRLVVCLKTCVSLYSPCFHETLANDPRMLYLNSLAHSPSYWLTCKKSKTME